MVNFMFLQYIDNDKKWDEFLNYKIFSLYSYKKEKRLFKDFISNRKYKDITSKLKTRSYSFSIPEKNYINKGNSSKKRVVYKFQTDELIVLKYISYLLYDYDNIFCDNLYSFRKNITMKDAIYKIKNNIDKDLFAYKVDISNYFNSIEKDILLNNLEKDIVDRDLFNVINDIINNDKVIYNDKIICENKGILAGCPLSAFLANYYLKNMDYYFYNKGILYFRYSDDIIIFSDNKESLTEYSNYIKEFLDKYKLSINTDKEFFYDKNDIIEFLGFSFDNGLVDISSNSINKAKSRLKRSSRKLRCQIETSSLDIEEAVKIMIKKNDKKFYGNKREELSWKYWFFPIINTTYGLETIDHYYQDCIRYLFTGKHNKRNYKLVPYDKLKSYGYKSLVHEYYRFIKSLKMD